MLGDTELEQLTELGVRRSEDSSTDTSSTTATATATTTATAATVPLTRFSTDYDFMPAGESRLLFVGFFVAGLTALAVFLANASGYYDSSSGGFHPIVLLVAGYLLGLSAQPALRGNLDRGSLNRSAQIAFGIAFAIFAWLLAKNMAADDDFGTHFCAGALLLVSFGWGTLLTGIPTPRPADAPPEEAMRISPSGRLGFLLVSGASLWAIIMSQIWFPEAHEVNLVLISAAGLLMGAAAQPTLRGIHEASGDAFTIRTLLGGLVACTAYLCYNAFMRHDNSMGVTYAITSVMALVSFCQAVDRGTVATHRPLLGHDPDMETTSNAPGVVPYARFPASPAQRPYTPSQPLQPA